MPKAYSLTALTDLPAIICREDGKDGKRNFKLKHESVNMPKAYSFTALTALPAKNLPGRREGWEEKF